MKQIDKTYLIDFKKLARIGEPMVQQIPAKQLGRCGEYLQLESVVAITLHGRHELGAYFLDVSVSADLRLNCQRCMEDFEHQLTITESFIIVESEFEENITTFSDYEPVVQIDKSRINLLELVEEEILLNLPAIPMHQEDSLCRQDVAKLAV